MIRGAIPAMPSEIHVNEDNVLSYTIQSNVSKVKKSVELIENSHEFSENGEIKFSFMGN